MKNSKSHSKHLSIGELFYSFQDWALFNHDGTVSRFRVSCLSLFALSLLLHVALKPNGTDYQDPSLVATRADATAQAVPVQTSVSRGSMSQGNESNNLMSMNSTQQTAAVDEEWEEEEVKSAWYMFGFGDEERKKKQQLAANRKAAASEIIDGAAFLSACGNINSGYIGCRFSFSEKIQKNFDSTVEAADDGFMLTLTAKGNQLSDRCSRFVVNSEGVYQAFDRNGALNNKCFGSSIKSSEVLSIRNNEDQVHSSNSQSGLASN